MKELPLLVTPMDIEHIRHLIAAHSDDPFVKHRSARNVDGPAPAFDREMFWYVHLACLLTTRQRSTVGSPVNRFLKTSRFPLSLANCSGSVRATIENNLASFGGIRFIPTIAKRAEENYQWLFAAGWQASEEQFHEACFAAQ